MISLNTLVCLGFIFNLLGTFGYGFEFAYFYSCAGTCQEEKEKERHREGEEGKYNRHGEASPRRAVEAIQQVMCAA